MNNELRLEGQK